LRSLGWNGDKPQTKREASQLIETLKAQSQSEAPF